MTDKMKHIAAGMSTAFVGIPVYQLAYDATTDTHHLAAAIWATIMSGILIAVCKEWCDNNTEGNKWDWMDFLATCIGAVLVALFIVMLHFGEG